MSLLYGLDSLLISLQIKGIAYLLIIYLPASFVAVCLMPLAILSIDS